VSFESRRKKRAYKRATVKSRRTGESARRWFLTLAKKSGRFVCCGRRFEQGDEILYRHEPREVRCPGCAEREGLGFRRSQRWERAAARP